MTGTMTWVGMDVHARSTHAAAIDTMSGELRREKFGPGLEAPVAWLQAQPGPSLSQSGESSRQGAITKTGSTLARRLLVESAWHYGRQPAVGAALARRQDGQSPEVIAIANRAQRRLHKVHGRMRARGKPHHLTVVALARELSCFLWAAATD